MHNNYLEINLGALQRNHGLIREMTPDTTKIISVVKADAYGHGLIPVAKALDSCGADAFAIFDIEEAAALRRAGIAKPVMALSGIMPDQAPDAAEHDVSVTVYNIEACKALSAACSSSGQIGDVFVKVDTGMGRLGLAPEDMPQFLEQISKLGSIRIRGLISHFAASEAPENAHTKNQIALFDEVQNNCPNTPPLCQMANSGAILCNLSAGSSMVRPGIALYGSSPAPGIKNAHRLEPVMSFKTRVLSVKKVPANTPISYGMTYTTKRESVIAVIPAGYANGYSRSLSNKGEALVRGMRAPVVGVVCMNLTILDVTDIGNVSPGDEVVLLGRQQDRIITAEEIAVKAGTISYEIYCAFGRANPRVYVEQ